MIEALPIDTHEQVLRCTDPSVGYHGIIALHSTRLGPAVGGTRFWRYDSEEAALLDALRLSRGMSFKNALAGLPFGGGKSVILDQGGDRTAVLEAHARAISTLEGRYITAEDVGTTVGDMEVMRRITPHIAGLSSGAGDPSPFTARGVLRALQACCEFRFGSSDVKGRTVAIQGLGAVGYQLARQLHELGARLLVADVMPERSARAAEELGALVCSPDDIMSAPADILAPCALGAGLNRSTIPHLRCEIVVGAANNQLAGEEDGAALHERGITYGPDYVANAGGVISGSVDILGWSLTEARRRIDGIYDTMLTLLQEAARNNTSASAAADALAKKAIEPSGVRPTG